MRREELAELAKVHGIELNVELTDENLEAVVGGIQKGSGGGRPSSSSGGFSGSKLFSGGGSSRTF